MSTEAQAWAEQVFGGLWHRFEIVGSAVTLADGQIEVAARWNANPLGNRDAKCAVVGWGNNLREAFVSAEVDAALRGVMVRRVYSTPDDIERERALLALAGCRRPRAREW